MTIPPGIYLWQAAVARRIDQYKPHGHAAGWSRVQDEVRATITAAEPLTPYNTAALMGTLAKLALFADSQGHAPDRRLWLSREFIERFVLVGCLEVSDATRSTYRCRLLRLSEAILGHDCRTGPPVKLSASQACKPYNPAETSALWSWACGQPTEELRTGCTLLLTLGLGCGLESSEVVPLRAHDVQRLGNGAVVVQVRGRRSRAVVCRQEWEEILARQAERFTGQAAYLFRPSAQGRVKNTVTNFLSRTHPAPGTPALKTVRLRATWLVGLIEARLPLPVIVAAAGLDTLHALSRIMPYVRGVSPEAAARLLRGQG